MKFKEGEKVRVINIPSLKGEGVFSHEGRHGYGVTLDDGRKVIVRFDCLERVTEA